MDGCGNGRFFFKIALPLSKAIMAVLVLYLAVSYWDSYFNPMIFLTDRSKYPLALYLREILLTAATGAANSMTTDAEAARKLQTMVQVIKYGVIVVSTLPILCVYPFLQKYFVKGVMIGSSKADINGKRSMMINNNKEAENEKETDCTTGWRQYSPP